MANPKKHVIVTTEYRGVFYGQIDPKEIKETTVTLSECRNVIYWHSELKGFLGLSSEGPNSKCTIGAKAGGDVVIHKVTSIAECSDKSAQVWSAL